MEKRGRGKRKTEISSRRQSPPVEPVAPCWSLFTPAFAMAGGVPESFFWEYHLYTVKVLGIRGVVAGAIPII